MPWEKLHELQPSRRHVPTRRFLRRAKHALQLVIHVYCWINFFPLPWLTAFLQAAAPQRAKDILLVTWQTLLSQHYHICHSSLFSQPVLTTFCKEGWRRTPSFWSDRAATAFPALSGSFSKAQGDHVTWHYFWQEHAGTICISVSITNKHPAPSSLRSVPLCPHREHTSK